MPQLRVRQEECLASIRSNYIEGIHQQLVVKATGTGKTVVFSNIYSRMLDLLPGRMLVFAHREELVDQAVASLQFWNPGVKVGKEMASYYADLDCQIIVSCVQSIGREGATRMQRFGWDTIDKIVCDEAHHSIASTYLNVLNDAGVLLPGTHKLLVGFTATPKRKALTRNEKKQVTTLDEENLLQLKSVYKKIVFTYPIRKAIKEGWLCRLRGYRLKTETDISNVRKTAGDFQQDELSNAVNTPQRNEQVVKFWLDNADGRQTVGFCAGVKHAQDLAEKFRQHGVKAEAVWGEDPERHDHSKCDICGRYSNVQAEGRSCNKELESGELCHGVRLFGKGKLERHQKREITVLLNDKLLTEGYDDWRVRCVLLAAPTTNPSKFTQEVGRGTRLQEGAGNLLEAIAAGYALEKTDCIILDVVDNSKRNSLVTFPSLFSLNPDFDLHGADVVETVEKLEELEEKYAPISLAEVTDLEKVKAYVESVDLFAEPYTEEVKEFSKYTWMRTSDGSYVLPIPEDKNLAYQKRYAEFKHEKLRLDQNELEQWELWHITTKGEKLLGTFPDLKYAFEIADDVIVRCRGDRLQLLQRDAFWHKRPASDAAKKHLRRLTKKRPIHWCLCDGVQSVDKLCKTCGMKTGITAGQASIAINLLKARS